MNVSRFLTNRAVQITLLVAVFAIMAFTGNMPDVQTIGFGAAIVGSTMQEIKGAIDGIGSAFEEFKKTNDERLQAVKDGNESRAKELDASLVKINADIAKFSDLKNTIETELNLNRERIEELESRRDSPGKTASEKIKDEYKKVWIDWFRSKGQSPMLEQKMVELGRKEVTIGSNAAGGYALPEEIDRAIQKQARLMSPVRELVRVVQVGSNDYKELVSIGGTNSGWVGESGTRSDTNTSDLRERAPTFGELYAYPQASEWSLDDLFFNVEQWIAEEVGTEFAIQEGTAVISGNGSNKPTGMLNTAPTTGTDTESPVRNAAAYEYVASQTSPLSVEADELISLIYKLNSRYRVNATWVMNSATTGVVRKLKDGNSQYLWQPGLQAGQPDRLLGYSHSSWEQLDDVANGTFPIGFGDFRSGYVLADRVGMRITPDRVTNIGFVRFYIRKRVGGTVRDNNAVKWLGIIEND